MKFTNYPYLEKLTLVKDGETQEFISVNHRRLKTLCDLFQINYTDLAEAINTPGGIRELHIDLDEYYASKKENNMNSMNIGSEIVYVTPATPRLQAMKVTKDNIIQAAQWCGSSVIYVPSGPDRWSFDIGKERANVGDVIVRTRHGDFEVMDQEGFFEKYDRV